MTQEQIKPSHYCAPVALDSASAVTTLPASMKTLVGVVRVILLTRLATLFCLLLCTAVSAQTEPVSLLQAHAHNDYLHARPLLDALEHGFCSVEADIYLVDGKLLVAHDRSKVQPERTLEKLYLDPLRQRVRRNGGRVYPGGPEVTLLIDLKTDWPRTYPVLRSVLTNYSDMLTTFENGVTHSNAIRAILTGNRAPAMFTNEIVRVAALDGTLTDLDSSASAALIPWISSNWRATFKWQGNGAIPPDEQRRLKEIVVKTHQHGRRVRFWGAPDNPVFWSTILDAGVDLINTDDLAGAESFLRSSQRK